MQTITLDAPTVKQAVDPSKPLKLNHERFLNRYIGSGNATESYLSLYNCERRSGEQSAWELLRKPEVKARLAYLIENAPKTSAEGAIIKLGQRMEAQRAVVVPAGASVQFVDDNQAQISAATTILKLHGRLKDGVTINNQSNTFVAAQASNTVERISKVVDILSGIRHDKLIDIVGTVVGKT